MPQPDPPSAAPPYAAPGPPAWIDLSGYTTGGYDPGGGRLGRLVWWYVSLFIFESGWFPITKLKPAILRWFGATVGRGVVIKTQVRIKYPWRLTIGDHCWIGQDVWIDNVSDTTIGSHACLSQGVYLCGGSHNYRTPGFDLILRPIHIEDGAWLGAKSTVLCGVTVGANAILSAGSVAASNLKPGAIATGNPAVTIRERKPVVE